MLTVSYEACHSNDFQSQHCTLDLLQLVLPHGGIKERMARPFELAAQTHGRRTWLVLGRHATAPPQDLFSRNLGGHSLAGMLDAARSHIAHAAIRCRSGFPQPVHYTQQQDHKC